MPTEGGQEGLPGSATSEQISSEHTPDQSQSGVPQQEVSSERGLSKLTSILKTIVQTIRGNHEQSGVVDPDKLNPLSTKEPQSSQKFPPGQPSTS